MFVILFPDTDLLPELSIICPIQGPVAITLTSPLLDDEVGWLDWLDCPLDDDELDIVVLLSLLVHPDAKTTKTKIPIIPIY